MFNVEEETTYKQARRYNLSSSGLYGVIANAEYIISTAILPNRDSCSSW